MQGNLVVKGIVFAVVLITGVVVAKKSGSTDEVTAAPISVVGGGKLSPEALVALGIEGDTERDTVLTLVERVKDLQEQVGSMEDTSSALRDDVKDQMEMENSIASKLRGAMQMELKEGRIEQSNFVNQKLEEMTQILARFDRKTELTASSGNEADYYGNEASRGYDEMVIIKPLEEDYAVGDGLLGQSGGSMPWDTTRNAASRILGRESLPIIGSIAPIEEEIRPVYTIAKNSTLVGSTAFTALIGRVPVGQNVIDPYSFRILIGKDNLIANGIELPEVSYAVASGKAVGDWTLGCVRGNVMSMTFVFEDGTIRTVPEAKDIYSGASTSSDVVLGELADNFGNPCVVGERISNAKEYLAQRVAVTGFEAAAEAAAASQTTTLTTVDGSGIGVGTVVTGSTGEYIAGRMLSDGASEVANFVDERQANQFDAIYVGAGVKVAVLINEQINIDYDPRGRKTNHIAFAFGGNNRELD